MTEEVANVMLFSAGLEQSARELPPQVVEAQSSDACACAGPIPRHLDGFDLLPAFVAEHECGGWVYGAVWCVLAHLQLRPQARPDRNHPSLIGLRLRSRQHNPPRVAVLVPADLRPLE